MYCFPRKVVDFCELILCPGNFPKVFICCKSCLVDVFFWVTYVTIISLTSKDTLFLFNMHPLNLLKLSYCSSQDYNYYIEQVWSEQLRLLPDLVELL